MNRIKIKQYFFVFLLNTMYVICMEIQHKMKALQTESKHCFASKHRFVGENGFQEWLILMEYCQSHGLQEV